MTKTRLKIEFDFDFTLIGIVTPLQDYRMAWFLNNIMHKALKKTEDHLLKDEKNRRVMSFSKYYFEEAITKSYFFLLENKHEIDCLLPEMKELDYLLMINGDYYKSRKTEILKKIRSLDDVQTAVILKPSEIKSKNNLIMEDDQ